TPPVISQAGPNGMIECPATPVFTPPTAKDNCDPNPKIVLVSDVTTPGACPDTYTETMTWKAVDACNNESGLVTQTITVQDTTAPMITCPKDFSVTSAQLGPCQYEVSFTVTAKDACDPAPIVVCTTNGVVVTSPNVFPGGVSTLVTCTATDTCGN